MHFLASVDDLVNAGIFKRLDPLLQYKANTYELELSHCALDARNPIIHHCLQVSPFVGASAHGEA